MALKKSKRGGRRVGAGRPPLMTDSVMLSLRVERDLFDELGDLADEQSVSSYVREVLRRHVKRRRS